ncbi:MAG: hypothetical protein ACI9H8_001448 [Lysobacterales bacterium]|jgi:hypothetical protein
MVKSTYLKTIWRMEAPTRATASEGVKQSQKTKFTMVNMTTKKTTVMPVPARTKSETE